MALSFDFIFCLAVQYDSSANQMNKFWSLIGSKFFVGVPWNQAYADIFFKKYQHKLDLCVIILWETIPCEGSVTSERHYATISSFSSGMTISFSPWFDT